MWTDNETERDFLNFTGVAGTVAEIVLQAQGKPISIGVSGAWGVGKSSMIKLVRKSLAERGPAAGRDFIYVDFNAWLYQGYDDARAALMEVIAQTLEDEAKSRETGIDKVKEFLARIDWFRAAKLAAGTGAAVLFGVPTPAVIESAVGAFKKIADGGLGAEAIEEAKTAANAAVEEGEKLLRPKRAATTPPKEIHALRKSFEEALEAMGVTLVVLIDDLDRCLPETTISTLEAIRLFLFLKNTAFVIAADDEMIKHAVKRHFDDISDTLVVNYFDKLIQLPIRVPPLGTQEVRAYMMLLYIENSDLAPELKEKIRAAVCERLSQSWQGKRMDRAFLTEAFPGLSPEVQRKLDTAERLSTLMATAKGVSGNPRLIKRFLNAVSIRMAIARAQSVGVDEDILAKLLLFERLGDKTLYAHITASVLKSENGKSELLAKMEKDALADKELPPEWDAGIGKDWLVLPPTLGDKDLRGALYVSREHAPLIAPGDLLSSEGADLLDALSATPKLAKSLKPRLAKLSRKETPIVFDRLLGQAGQVQAWGAPDILEALLALVEADPALGPRLEGFLLDRPPKQIEPAIIPKLSDQPWAKGLIERWKDNADVSSPVKKAIGSLGEKKK